MFINEMKRNFSISDEKEGCYSSPKLMYECHLSIPTVVKDYYWNCDVKNPDGAFIFMKIIKGSKEKFWAKNLFLPVHNRF